MAQLEFKDRNLSRQSRDGQLQWLLTYWKVIGGEVQHLVCVSKE